MGKQIQADFLDKRCVYDIICSNREYVVTAKESEDYSLLSGNQKDLMLDILMSNQKLSDLAKKRGLSRASISKTVKKIKQKGYLVGDRKNLKISQLKIKA